jgi:hypothetical protein
MHPYLPSPGWDVSLLNEETNRETSDKKYRAFNKEFKPPMIA